MELISKKEVLRQTGISYGQLYRWKRKGLIPEAWFIRKATPTGQETFLPKGKILERIRRIQELKEERSLDELVRLLSPEVAPEAVSHEDPRALPVIGKEGGELMWKAGGYTFTELVALAAGAQALRNKTQLHQARLLVDLARQLEEEVKAPTGHSLVLAEKSLDREGISVRISFALSGKDPLRLDPECKVLVRLDLEQLVERVKKELEVS
ncbi:YhbD family protein [Candidatus Bipolaricaulota bacterium]|nr:YhbD family protein [Candidatus Bipolaricaulota bacterium]